MPTVLVAGGGTGGHIFPGIAIARELMERIPGCDVIFVGTERGLETKIVPAEGFRLLTIRSAGIAGKRLAARLKGVALIPFSVLQCLALIGRMRPGLVIGVGGYASGPVLAAAVIRRVPTLIHEQNYVPGATNHWVAPWVKKVIVTFPETIECLGGRGEAIGNPVRKEFALVKPRPVNETVKSLLIFGGSQGARVINRAVCEALPELAAMRPSLRVVHQTGDAELSRVREAYASAGFTGTEVDVRPFISGMSEMFERSDLIICRSGATTVAELTAAGRPAVLIPFARATHDHQTFNARKLVEEGAALMIPEHELNGAVLAGNIRSLLGSPQRLTEMAQASRRLGKPAAGARIAAVCASLLGEVKAA